MFAVKTYLPKVAKDCREIQYPAGYYPLMCTVPDDWSEGRRPGKPNSVNALAEFTAIADATQEWAGDYKPSRWFTLHTTITGEQLRKAKQKNKLAWQKDPRGGQNLYSLSNAKTLWGDDIVLSPSCHSVTKA